MSGVACVECGVLFVLVSGVDFDAVFVVSRVWHGYELVLQVFAWHSLFPDGLV